MRRSVLCALVVLLSACQAAGPVSSLPKPSNSPVPSPAALPEPTPAPATGFGTITGHAYGPSFDVFCKPSEPTIYSGRVYAYIAAPASAQFANGERQISTWGGGRDSFRFDGVPVGVPVTLTLEMTGGTTIPPRPATVTVSAAGSTISQDLTATGPCTSPSPTAQPPAPLIQEFGSIAGTIRTSDFYGTTFKTAAGATVTLSLPTVLPFRFTNGSATVTQVADSQGHFLFSGVPVGVHVTASGSFESFVVISDNDIVVPTPGGTMSRTLTLTELPCACDPPGRATIPGEVYDDLGNRVDGATLMGRIQGYAQFANGSDTQQTSTKMGSYFLEGAPTGSTVIVTASKPGMTSRQKTIVPLGNFQGNKSLNRVTFGSDAVADPAASDALSDKPEVQAVSPAPGTTGVSPTTPLSFTFSEPVNHADVESGLVVYVAGQAGGSYTTTDGRLLPVAYQLQTNTPTTSGSDTLSAAAVPVLRGTDYAASWSADDLTVVFTPRSGTALPISADAAGVPTYAVTFAGPIRDRSGTARQSGWFWDDKLLVSRQAFAFQVAPARP